ncbi:unnamed protein product, partial [marine sediment metagenome]
ALFLAFLLAFPHFGGIRWTGVFSLMSITLIAVFGLHITTGLCGQINLGQAAFMAVGAYTSAVLTSKLGLPFLVALPCAGIMAGAVGLIFGAPSLRIKGFYLAMSTLAAQFIIIWAVTKLFGAAAMSVPYASIGGFVFDTDTKMYYLIIALTLIATLALGYLLEGVAIMAWGADTKGMPEFIPREAIWLGPVSIAQHYLWAFGIAILLFVLLYLFFRYTKMGLGMQIVSEDQQVARSLGIRVKNILAQSWAFALVIAAISGILFASLNSVNNGNAMIGLTKALPVMLLGGLESLYGALVGGIIVGIFEIEGGQSGN